MFSPEFLKECFDYDAISGEIFWSYSRPRGHFPTERSYRTYMANIAGLRAGGVGKYHGYRYVTVCQKLLKEHRVIYALHFGQHPEGLIDHIDRDKTNNKIENLRIVSDAINSRNTRKYSNNTSGYTGVYFHKAKRHWRARVRHDGKLIHIGSFPTAEQANSARVAYLQDNPQLGFTDHHGQ